MLLLSVTIRESNSVVIFHLFFPRKDSFTLTCATHLGRLNKIRIGHDNTGFGAAWFLDKASCLDIPNILGSFIYHIPSSYYLFIYLLFVPLYFSGNCWGSEDRRNSWISLPEMVFYKWRWWPDNTWINYSR